MPLDFPGTAYGVDREQADMPIITERMAAALGAHRERPVPEEQPESAAPFQPISPE